MREVGKDDEKGMVSDVEGVRSLDESEMSSSMKDEICGSMVVVVALMVVVRVVVLMVALGVVVLVIVMRVLYIGVSGVVGAFCIGAVEWTVQEWLI